MCRLCALHIVERLKGEVGAAAMAHFQHLALARARRQTQRQVAKQNRANASAQVSNSSRPFADELLLTQIELSCTKP